MRTFTAYLLLGLISFQWIGGRMGMEVVYRYEVTHSMNDAEQALSAALLAETGLESHIDILDKDQFDPRTIGYSNFLHFSREVDGQCVYFMIDPNPVDLVAELIPENPGDGQQNKATFPKRYFSDFHFNRPDFLMMVFLPAWPVRNFIIERRIGLLSASIPTPPPEVG